MKLIVGLGNPGKQYEKTRHNLGFMVLDALAEKYQVQFSAAPKFQAEFAKLSSSVLLCKPQTFMNNSGQAVKGMIEYYKLQLTMTETASDLVVVHDDLDLPLGSVKLQLGTGPKVHNGLLSIYEHLSTKSFWHLRAGVDNRGELRAAIKPSEYVLSAFTAEEQPQLQEEIATAIELLQF